MIGMLRCSMGRKRLVLFLPHDGRACLLWIG